jgi:hypothetical protein
MKAKKIFLAVISLLVLGCSDNEDLSEDEDIALSGTQWKLSGIADVETNVLKELEPAEYEDGYTIVFDTDSTGWSMSAINTIMVKLWPETTIKGLKKVKDTVLGDVKLFYDIIETVRSYELVNNELKFFYNEEKNYLLFSRVFDDEGRCYIDTNNLNGTGYVFLNSVPSELQNKKNVTYIIYNETTHLATFSADYPEASYNGDILNFSEFTTGWKIPDEGMQIDYAGRLYQLGIYLSVPPMIGGLLILTTLKNNE